jgi:hypothetical protein
MVSRCLWLARCFCRQCSLSLCVASSRAAVRARRRLPGNRVASRAAGKAVVVEVVVAAAARLELLPHRRRETKRAA